MIEVRDVTKIHQSGETEVRALQGVSCRFPGQTFSFILGPSGSGKSTLLYLMGALDAPSTGEIFVQNRSLSTLNQTERDTYRREKVGFVFQSFNLLKNLNALENVLAPYLPQGVTAEQKQRAEALLKQVGLGQRITHRPNQLSGGEQQRVAIARALLKRPLLILADEPTGELDTKTGAEIFSCLRDMSEQYQTTVVIVTHDERYIRETDYIIRLRDGKIAEENATD
ncbi:Lipoprotein-releasing system ATP-binding protein LolD [Gimesia alba]|uniref:Lipoprotein-releasing system ATP-binding protein LolD n=1 Tax=Gimesia alba TaxID=2527973 RepID=A0A517RIV0_9PLAN|nr:ABC transporter ATP-binding protein [Gimesia alba]QDT43790.1 Lipoprotein-releasing system ATP-binding protein LolD [Gimesia alba]